MSSSATSDRNGATNTAPIGQTVNLAARIESMTIGGQILISEPTLQSVQNAFKLGGQLRVKVKGLSMPIQIYEVSTNAEQKTHCGNMN